MIRDATASDAAAVAAIYRPHVEGGAASFEEVPPTVVEMRRRMAASRGWLVFEVDGEVVGYAYAAPFHSRPAYRWSAEISIYLRDGHRGSGIGGVLLDALIERLRADGFVNALAGIAIPNPASQRLFESRGFQQRATYPHVGYKAGAWRDVGWWQLALREPPAAPDPGPVIAPSAALPVATAGRTYAPPRTNRLARLVALALLIATVLQLAAGALLDLDQFAGKAFGTRLVAYPAMMLALPVIWWLVNRRRTGPAGWAVPWDATALVMWGFFVDVTGNALDLYDTIDWWDDANHFANWLTLSLGVGICLAHARPRPRWVLAAATVGAGAILAIGWELGEWFTFIRHGTELSTAYEDTLGDEALGTLGAAVGAGLVVLIDRRRSTDR